MSDLTATQCGCSNTNNNNNNGCGCGNGTSLGNIFGNNGDNSCCSSLIWIILLFSCCGCGN